MPEFMTVARRGILITFEGGDGVGKSTQIRMLKKALEKIRLKTFVTREPGGTKVGDILRRIHKQFSIHARTELLVLEASRAEHVEAVLRPKLKQGAVILCDRYEESSLVYQGIVRGLGLDLVARANALATGGLKSDLVILLDPKSLDRKRLATKGKKDRFDHASDSFHQKVFAGYRQIASKDRRFRVYPATGHKQEIHKLIFTDVIRILQKKGLLKKYV
jgi:dTMP kinase